MRGALVGVALALAACGGGKGAAHPSLSGAPAVDPADRLMAFVPADASFVFVRDQQASLADRFTDLARAPGAFGELRDLLRGDGGAGSAFAAELLDALSAPGAAHDALGWREGQSVLVGYGLGFDTVVRATLDGDRLRATLERAAARSHFALVPQAAGGHAYYRIDIPTPAFAITLLLRIDRDGAVAAIGGDDQRLLDEVLADEPRGPRFDAAAVIAAAYPDRRASARFSMAIAPARLSSALAQVVARRPAWLAPFRPCVAAGVDLLAATPAVGVAWVPAPTGLETVGVVEVGAATAERLAHDVQPIPRWPAGDDRMRIGAGVTPRAFLVALEPWLTAVEHTIDACGGNSGVVAMLHPRALPPPLELLGSAALELDLGSKTMAAVIGASDPQALWAMLRSFLPLRPQPPARGEQVAFQGMTFVGGGDVLGVAAGAGGGDVLAALLAAGPGPRELFAFEMPRGVLDELRRTNPAFASSPFGSLAFHVGVRDRRILVRMTAETVGAAPQLAH